MKLRPYQQAAIDATRASIMNGHSPCLCLATGAGKSLVQAELVRLILQAGKRVLCLTHVKELIEQNYNELHTVDASIDAGIYSAGLNRRDTEHSCIFAGVQSVAHRMHEFESFSFVIIDEAHLLSPNAETRYQRVVAHLRKNGPVPIIGMSATPFRLGQGFLTDGGNAIFTEIVTPERAGVAELIEDGYLSMIRTKSGSAKADLSGVHHRGGEFVEAEMQDAMEPLIYNAISDIQQHSARKGILIFAASVKAAEMACKLANMAGIHSAVVTGKTPKNERESLLAAYKRQEIRCLCSVGVLTTGFNAPHVDLICLLRATESCGLLAQMAGRGLRNCDGKGDCLILDYGLNFERLGPLDAPIVYSKGAGDPDAEAPCKECPECSELVHAALRECSFCGFQFPPPEPKIEKEASDAAALSANEEPVTHGVEGMYWQLHKKSGSPDMIKIVYRYGMMGINTAYDFICLEHDGFAQRMGQKKFHELTGEQAPLDTLLALTKLNNINPPAPKRIVLKRDGKYQKIVRIEK